MTGDPREWVGSWFQTTRSVERSLLRGGDSPVRGGVRPVCRVLINMVRLTFGSIAVRGTEWGDASRFWMMRNFSSDFSR
jgi:hypothetical protein